ncbi:MAG: aminoacyl-tRNA deacylase [Candidatus Aquicultor sp.]
MRTSVDLHNYLQSLEVPHEISLVEMPARTAAMAAMSLGLDQSEIGKTLIVEADGNPLVAMIPGSRRLDVRKLKAIIGVSKIKLVEPEDAVSLTGYILGSIPPLAHANEMPIYIDLRLLSIPVIYTCGGQTNAVLKIKPTDLISAGNAQIVDIADDGRV